MTYGSLAAIPLAIQPEWVDVDADIGLMRRHSMDELDVEKTEDGFKLKKLSFCDKITQFFFCCARQARINRLIEYVGAAENAAPRIVDREALKSFYKELHKWTLFRLGNISKDVQIALSPARRAAFLAHEAAHRALIAAKRSRVSDEIEKQGEALTHAEWDLKRTEVMLATELGVPLAPAGGGVNGAAIGKGLDGSPLLVIKRIGHDTRHPLMTEKVVFQRTQPEVCRHDTRVAGSIAYMADEYFGFDLIPPTYTDPETRWSMQTFVPGSVAADVARIRGRKLRDIPAQDLTENQLEQLQMKTILNFALGDLDGKDDKLRLRLGPDGSILSIYETDNDNVLPHETLDPSQDSRTLTKTHAWKKHEWAKAPFQVRPGSKMARVLRKLLDPKEIYQFMSKTEARYPGFWTADRLRLMNERIATIRFAIDNNFSPAQLGEFFSPESEYSKRYRAQIDEAYVPDVDPFDQPLNPIAEAYSSRWASRDE